MFFAAGADQLGGLVEDGGEVGAVGGGVGGAAVGDAEGGGVELGAGSAEGAEEKAAHCVVLWAGAAGIFGGAVSLGVCLRTAAGQ